MDLSALCQGFHAAERACVKDVCPESISVAGHITVWVHSNEHSIVRTISHAYIAYIHNCIHIHSDVCTIYQNHSKPSSKRCIS